MGPAEIPRAWDSGKKELPGATNTEQLKQTPHDA